MFSVVMLSLCSCQTLDTSDCYYGGYTINRYLVDANNHVVLDKNTGQPIENPEFTNMKKCLGY